MVSPTCFTEDGVFDPGADGFEPLEGRERHQRVRRHHARGMVHHMTTDAAYDVTGDAAAGAASFLVVAKGAIVTTGRYHDDLAGSTGCGASGAGSPSVMRPAEELRFDDRAVVVTGGGAGLGREYALLLAAAAPVSSSPTTA